MVSKSQRTKNIPFLEPSGTGFAVAACLLPWDGNYGTRMEPNLRFGPSKLEPCSQTWASWIHWCHSDKLVRCGRTGPSGSAILIGHAWSCVRESVEGPKIGDRCADDAP